MKDDSGKPKLKFGQLVLPSDKITWGDIRRGRDESMEKILDGETGGSIIWESCLDRLISTELKFAANAFAKRVGLPQRFGTVIIGRDKMLEGMDELYQYFGISSGLNESRELLRRIEQSAEAQASAYLSR